MLTILDCSGLDQQSAGCQVSSRGLSKTYQTGLWDYLDDLCRGAVGAGAAGRGCVFMRVLCDGIDVLSQKGGAYISIRAMEGHGFWSW